MVLQRGPAQAVIWGWDVAGSKITVTINNGVWTAATGQDAMYAVQLAPFAAGGPYKITVASSAGGMITLDNVMFGDVYVCSGQSNMQMTVHSLFNASDEIALAAKYPQIRIFSVGQGSVSDTPVQNLLTFDLPWSVATPDLVGKGDWSYMSGLCWMYGRYLADRFPALPIGLISSNWGGTIVEAWSSPDALSKCPRSNPIVISKAADKYNMFAVNTTADPNQPSVLWNAMIVPFLRNPIKAALWYQGESNAGDPGHYGCLFSSMITDWRAKFAGHTNFPFFFVQLAPWVATGDTIPATRTAQLDALKLPNVGFATAVDLGDISSPFGDIHPRDKQDIAKRMLLSARVIAYGETNVVYKGPMATTFTVTSTSSIASITVGFAADTVSGGLMLTPEQPCPGNAQCVWYAIQLDTNWVRATATVKGSTELVISVANPSNAKVVAVKYAYAAWPMCNLWNGAKLPAIPFLHNF